jgi:hypothetical protein
MDSIGKYRFLSEQSSAKKSPPHNDTTIAHNRSQRHSANVVYLLKLFCCWLSLYSSLVLFLKWKNKFEYQKKFSFFTNSLQILKQVYSLPPKRLCTLFQVLLFKKERYRFFCKKTVFFEQKFFLKYPYQYLIRNNLGIIYEYQF